MTAYLLLAAIAWAGATRGGTDARDLAIAGALVAVAMVAARAWPRDHPALWVTWGVLLAYLVADGPLRTGWSLDSIRMPVLIVLVTMAFLTVSRMRAGDREVLISGLIILGTLQAVIALAAAVVSAIGRGTELSTPLRGEGVLGFPNGLGILLVATSVLTVRQLTRARRRGILASALGVQVAAILVTGSRSAILIGGILVVVALAVRFAAPAAGRRSLMWRRMTGYGLVLCAAAAGAAVVAWRTVAEPSEDRPQLWLEAVQRIGAAPLLGEGAPAGAFGLVSRESRVTTSAHNEVLQWVLEYGLIGLGLAVAVVVLALRGTRAWSRGDRWALVAALALLVSGLTGFSPRITVVALAAAVLLGLGVTAAPDDTDADPRKDRAAGAAGAGTNPSS